MQFRIVNSKNKNYVFVILFKKTKIIIIRTKYAFYRMMNEILYMLGEVERRLANVHPVRYCLGGIPFASQHF